MAIRDSSGNIVARYAYDAWGKVLSVTNASGTAIPATQLTNIANLNTYRYRGYRYDIETGLYYLQSRYYDPMTGRFINADGYIDTNQGIGSINVFSYCGNNPVNRLDLSGLSFRDILEIVGGVLGLVAGVAAIIGGFAAMAVPEPTMLTKVVGYAGIVAGFAEAGASLTDIALAVDNLTKKKPIDSASNNGGTYKPSPGTTNGAPNPKPSGPVGNQYRDGNTGGTVKSGGTFWYEFGSKMYAVAGKLYVVASGLFWRVYE